MNDIRQTVTSRREFLKSTGRIAAVSALAGAVIPHVHAAENNTIQVALVGCGGQSWPDQARRDGRRFHRTA
jgi:hypothetical protein